MKATSRSGVIAAALGMVPILLAACSSAPPAVSTPSAGPAETGVQASTQTPTATVAATPDLARPVGIIAIGHSGLTGEGTAGIGQANPAGSWATGTLPAVNSVYLRLVAAVPATEGHVANLARGGASAQSLRSQAEAALELVPVPALAIIATLDSDLQCDGANIGQVGEWIEDALAAIHDASPNTMIVVVGQFGRPTVDGVRALVTRDPSAKASLIWDDSCTFFTADGQLNPSGIAKLSATIDAYEAEQARVCATIPSCATDGGVRKAYDGPLDHFAADWAHLNVAGQAAQADLMWPVVERLLGL